MRPRLTPRRLVIAVVLAALLVGAGTGYRWWTHPTLLGEHASAGSFEYDPRPLAGGASYQAVLEPFDTAGETVVLNAITARFRTNTARATASFLICRGFETPLGAGAGEKTLHESCDRATPVVDGTKLRLGPTEYVLMALTPTRPGTVVVDRVTFDYQRSWKHLRQHGTESGEGRTVDHVR